MRIQRQPHLFAASFAALLTLACAPNIDATQLTRFDLPRGGRRHFLDIPWPCDIDRYPDGRIHLRTFPNPSGSSTLEDYIALAEKLRGFANNGSVFLDPGAALDGDLFPDTAAAGDPEAASIQLIDVDPRSEQRGTRFPLRIKQYHGETDFMPDTGVAVAPVLGFPLRPDTVYAVIFRDRLRTQDGARLQAPPDLRALLASTPPEDPTAAAAYPLFAPLRELYEIEGRPTDEIALATVFRTRSPTRITRATAVDLMRRNSARVQTLAPVGSVDDHPDFVVYEGQIELDQFQRGSPPFTQPGSGALLANESDVAAVQRRELLPFALTVPRGDKPAAGWPVALVAHGTGGWWRGFIGDDDGDQATFLARAGWAALGISQPLHRDREGYAPGQEELLTFNFFNPTAGISNWQQSALETVALATRLAEGDLPLDGGGVIDVDPQHIGFFGHSQGGLSGAIALGVDANIRTAMLSGAGGGFAVSLLEKTSPTSPMDAIRTILSLPDEPLDKSHPLLTLLQLLAESADPLNYAAGVYDRPDRGWLPDVLMSSGYVDSYTPIVNHAPLAVALGLPLSEPIIERPPLFDLAGTTVVTPPLAGNIQRGALRATGAMAQFAGLGHDGHFVVFYNARAIRTVQTFFRTARGDHSVIDPGTQ